MIWNYLFVPCALGLAYALFVVLRTTLVRVSNSHFSPYRLGLAAFALILSGIVTLDVRDGFGSAPIWPVRSFFEDFGWLLIVSGLIFLFILFCVSLSRPNPKLNEKTENAVGEYLR